MREEGRGRPKHTVSVDESINEHFSVEGLVLFKGDRNADFIVTHSIDHPQRFATIHKVISAPRRGEQGTIGGSLEMEKRGQWMCISVKNQQR